ncbi:hypothetical protein NYG88_03830 [Campylobacter felis]|uniref:hypothetical protein n=1 Tax=Campylobacter felis TaxID=2974565 RepID=UPI00256BF5FB|nr:hypothetical protein [Campylobacter felis]
MSDEVREELTPSKEDFYNELKELLKDNTKWVEQVKMSLELLVHLYDSFLKIENKYDTSLEEVGEIASQTRQEGLKIEALNVKMGEDFLELQEEASGILQNVERLKDELIELENNVANDKDDTRALIQRGEALKSEFEEINTKLEEANTLNAEFVTLYGEKKAEITHTLEVARTQLEGYVNTNRTNLESQKEQILTEINRAKGEARAQLNSTDLNSQKDEILAEINRVKEELKKRIEDSEGVNNYYFKYILDYLNLPPPLPSDVEILPEGDYSPSEEEDLTEEGEEEPRQNPR